MTHNLVDVDEDLRRQNEKLRKINNVLMQRIERSTESSGEAYAQFMRATTLEEEVRSRTRDLERALDLLNRSNAQLSEANKETEAARSNLANAIEAIQEGFAFFSPDDELIMCNSRFGLHMPDLRDTVRPGLSFHDYVNVVSKSPHLDMPDGMTSAQWAESRMARHKDEHVLFNVSVVGNHWVQVSEHKTPDGGTVILQTDVTDMVRLQQQERERVIDDQARTVQATLDHLNQGVCIFDNQAKLLGWNQKARDLLSLPAQLFRIGTRFETLFRQFSRNSVCSADVKLEKIMAWISSNDKRPHLTLRLSIGPSRIIAVDAKNIPDNGFVISFSDVSAERKAIQAIRQSNERLEERVTERTLELEDALAEAERANESKSRFVAAASHDLLQPLSAAKLYLSSLNGHQFEGHAQEVAQKAERALASVENILGALLDISKLDAGKASLHVAPIKLNPVLLQLRDEFGPQAAAKGIEYRLVETSVTVVTDATYLRRILQNLISNAIRYTDAGKVLVGTRKSGGSVRVEVWDTGPGISEEDQETVYGEFRRVGSTISAAEGMGLGLAIVDRACALLNHPLELRSTVGRGTGFLVTFPRDHRIAIPSPGLDLVGDRKARDLGDLIVVMIENEASVREALELAMQHHWGLGVVSASSTSEALDKIAELGVAPDAIVADYQLGAEDTGLNSIASIRHNYGDIPACMISAKRSSRLSTACEEMGLPIFHKPVDLADLGRFLSSLTDSPTHLQTPPKIMQSR